MEKFKQTSDNPQSKREIENQPPIGNETITQYYQKFLRQVFPEMSDEEIKAKTETDLSDREIVSILQHIKEADERLTRENSNHHTFWELIDLMEPYSPKKPNQ